MQLVFENDATIGTGMFPDFVQFPKTEGQVFFINNGLLYGTPSNRLHGDFDSPIWQETVYISPKGDTGLSNLELKALSGFGIVGCYRTPTAQKLLINEYMFEMDKYLDSGSIKCSMDTPITSFTLSLENPLNENPEFEGNVAISEESSLLSPGSKVVFEFIIGDSEPYPMGTFYVDRSNFELLNEAISVDGRNIIGKALGDQSFDEENTFSYQILHQTLNNILTKANINADEMLIEHTTAYAGYSFDFNMSFLDGIMEILKALENWQIKELVDGSVVIGSETYAGFTRNSSYVFERDKDIFSRNITGLMCAVLDKKLSSEVGFRGIFKKVLIFSLVAIGHIVDQSVIGEGSVIRTAVIFFYLSNEGVSILENAAHIGLPVGLTKDNVKAYCRAHDLAGVKAQSNARITPDQGFCQCCGKPLQQIPGRKKLKFCSASCRQQWWNTHPEQVTRKALYSFTCACCGNLFTVYGNSSRKYCCHSCYIATRFKGGESHD